MPIERIGKKYICCSLTTALLNLRTLARRNVPPSLFSRERNDLFFPAAVPHRIFRDLFPSWETSHSNPNQPLHFTCRPTSLSCAMKEESIFPESPQERTMDTSLARFPRRGNDDYQNADSSMAPTGRQCGVPERSWNTRAALAIDCFLRKIRQFLPEVQSLLNI